MSLARAALRNASRSAPKSRSFASTAEGATGGTYNKEFEQLQHHAAETTNLWRKVSYYACIPAVAVATAWVWHAESEHYEHIEHIKHENGGELPETPHYQYLNVRAKPFPWGPNSLFFNPKGQRDMSKEE